MKRALLLAAVALFSFAAGRATASSTVNGAGIRQMAFKLPTGRGVALEVAGDNNRGLKGRRLRGGRGMLFVHGIGPAPRFTMAGVPQALGILHLDEAGKLLQARTMRRCRFSTWERCPVYPAPVGTVVSIELRPPLIAGLRPGVSILTPAAVELLVR